jgi:hypothetical protein
MSRRRRSSICPKCDRVQSARRQTCSGCGADLRAAGDLKRTHESIGRVLPSAWCEALAAGPPASTARVFVQSLLLLGMAWVSWTYAAASIERSQRSLSLAHQLLESANLVFHEAGHWILGVVRIDLLTTAGGSIMQLAIPAICVVAFLSRHPDAFAATFATWWTGQSMVDLAPYVADARAQRLILLGGVTGADRPGYHDWNNLLGRLGMLNWDGFLGGALHYGGLAVMAAGLVVGVAILRRQWAVARAVDGPSGLSVIAPMSD